MLKKIIPTLVIAIGLASCNSTDEQAKEQTHETTHVSENNTHTDDKATAEHQEMEKPAEVKDTPESTEETTDLAKKTETVEGLEKSTDKEDLKIVVESAQDASEEVAIEKKNSSLPETDEFKEEVVEKTKQVEEVKAVAPFSHSIFNGLLKKYVTSAGNVNYNGFKADRAKLQEYIALLKNNEPQSSWSSNKKLAYWINVYNANMIEVMLNNNIPSSVMNINGGKAWDLKVVKIGSKTYSLNDVEHNIIRKQFKEPRIHFACVCAAKSCPKLLNKAYTEANLKASLQAQAVYFINNTSKNEITSKNLKVSQLFNWYASDFGDINTYIRKYSKTEFKDDKDIEFQEYDWSINK